MSNDKWEIFQKGYEEDIKFIHYAMENSSDANYPEGKESQHLIKWLFETEHNPYGIFHKNPESAKLIYYARGFVELCGDIHHAICDDGDICYPVVDDRPFIYFGWEHDKNIREKLIVENEHAIKFMKDIGYYKPPTLTFLKNAYEFTKAYDEYEIESLRQFQEFEKSKLERKALRNEN